MLRIKNTLFFLFFSFSCFCNLPFQKEIDSIKHVLKKNYSAQTHVDLCNKLSTSNRHQGKFKDAIRYALRSEKLARKENYTAGLIVAYSQLGESYREMGQLKQAVFYLQKVLFYSRKNNDLVSVGNVYDQLGHIYYAKNDTAAAIVYHELALSKRIQSYDLYGQGNSYESLAKIYVEKGNLQAALKAYKNCLNVFRKLKTEKKRIALASANVGLVNRWTGNLKDAIMYLKQAGDIYEKLNDYEALNWVYMSIGEIYIIAEDYKKSEYYTNKSIALNNSNQKLDGLASSHIQLIRTYTKTKRYNEALRLAKKNLKYFLKTDQKVNLTLTYNQIAAIYKAQQQFQEALVAYEKSIELAQKVKALNLLTNCYNNTGEIYFKLKENDKAIANLNLALKYNETVQDFAVFSSTYSLLYQLYKRKGDYKSTCENLEKHLHYFKISKKNSDDFTNELFRLDTENDYLKEKIAIDKKASVLSGKLTKSKVQRNIAILGLVIVFSSGIFTYYLLQLKTKKSKLDQALLEAQQNENRLIKETERFKTQFLVNISHELRTPLTLINGHLEILKQKIEFEDNKHIQEIQRNGNRLLKLINDILKLSKAESGKYKLFYKQGGALDEVKALFQSFQSYAEMHSISYLFDCKVDVYFDFNKRFIYSSEGLNIILTNLLSNAFKFTPDEGQIKVVVVPNDDTLKISIIDNGIGISSESLPNIFDRFFQEDGKQQRAYDSSGIGLSLVKELTLLHGGTILVENNENGGCTFTFWLKSGIDENITAEGIAAHIPKNSSESISGFSEIYSPTSENELPVVLIVEDQPDLSEFIVQNLRSSYHCLVARNGNEGFEMAIEFIPDLIVSDIMMPEMNGYELCEKLKDQEMTSHIPVILLTAKAEQENRMQGLRIGANDYLTKPFSVAELNLRIQNQIITIKKNQQYFKLKNDSIAEEVSNFDSLNTRDKEFLDKMYQCIHTNISNFQLGVDLIASEMALSNSQLTRKLKSITDLTPASLIKEIRLEKAIEMLRDGETVAAVSWKIGYDNPAYFGKIFKAHFGFAPSETKQ